jgi:hypothetical protein
MKKNISENNRIFTTAQLGKLQEIISTVDCECPNHISSIVSSLFSFEDYSEKCFNKNDQDAAIHKMLYEKTMEARQIMEKALKEVCEFEKIDLFNT